jgi:hypothetical protein
MDYLELARKALEYFELIGGLCAFCKNSERVTTNGEVHCKVYGRTHPVVKCKSFEAEARLELKPEVEPKTKEPARGTQ